VIVLSGRCFGTAHRYNVIFRFDRVGDPIGDFPDPVPSTPMDAVSC